MSPPADPPLALPEGTERPRGGEPRIIPPEVFARPRPDAPAPPTAAALAPLVPLFALDVLTAFTVGMLPPLLPLMAADWALSAVEVGLINTVYGIGRLSASYPASQIRARWGTRAAVFLGLAGLLGGSLGCGLAPGFPGFLAGRLVMGLGASLTFLPVFAELLESSPARWRGRLANAFEGMAILSLAVGGVLAAAVAQSAGWRIVFVGAAGVMLTCGLTWRALDPRAGRHDPARTTGVRDRAAAGLSALAPVYLACLAMGMTWAGLFSTLVPLLGHGRYALGTRTIGLAFGAGYVAELLGLLAVGVVIDRVRREPLFLAGALGVAAGGLLMAVGARPVFFVLGLVAIGTGFAVWMIPATVLADRAGTPLPPAHLAAYRIALDAGMILGPVLLGGVAQLAGERAAVGAAGFVLVTGAVILARRPRAGGVQ